MSFQLWTPREADIIRLRFGLEGRDPLTLEEVGVKIGITRERVRQLQEQAIRHARKMQQHEKQFSQEEIDERNKISERRKILQDILGKESKTLDIKPPTTIKVEGFFAVLRIITPLRNKMWLRPIRSL